DRERRAAAAALGVKDVIFLRHADGLVENNLALRRELMAVVREREPHVVVTIDPWRRYQLHPDHRACGWAALDAVWAAREWNIFAEQVRPGREPWRGKEGCLFLAPYPDSWGGVAEAPPPALQAPGAAPAPTRRRRRGVRRRARPA